MRDDVRMQMAMAKWMSMAMAKWMSMSMLCEVRTDGGPMVRREDGKM